MKSAHVDVLDIGEARLHGWALDPQILGVFDLLFSFGQKCLRLFERSPGRHSDAGLVGDAAVDRDHLACAHTTIRLTSASLPHMHTRKESSFVDIHIHSYVSRLLPQETDLFLVAGAHR